MKIFTGKVVSKKMEKTATVAVERIVAHPVYKKRMRKTKKYHVHDELSSEVDQIVKFVACRPYSKLKRWKVVEVVLDGVDKKKKSVSEKKSVKKDTRLVNKKEGGHKK